MGERAGREREGRAREAGTGEGRGERGARTKHQAGVQGAEGERLRRPLGPSPVSMPFDVLGHLRIRPEVPKVSPAS